jgi:7,8-dihydropterin-6-yl-methyl-4-(beta-D-ribofuranosyl)aminobenzene 5'-phosphate synthase
LIALPPREILFDTGSDGRILLGNMQELGVDPRGIDTAVLSHPHGDHTGGLSALLQINPHLRVYLGRSFSRGFKKALQREGAKPVEITGLQRLFDAVYTTGELAHMLREQSLIIDTKEGLVVITGCAHPGIVKIAKTAVKQLNKQINLLIGGFHLGGARQAKVYSIIDSLQELGVCRVGPCHCTGDGAIELFKRAYKENFIEVGVGSRIRF